VITREISVQVVVVESGDEYTKYDVRSTVQAENHRLGRENQ
jgi:hypothetical protein